MSRDWGVSAQSIEITPLGIAGDRRFAIWADGRLVEQKLTPRLATIGADWDPSGAMLTLRHPDQGRYQHHARNSGTFREATWLLDEFTTKKTTSLRLPTML